MKPFFYWIFMLLLGFAFGACAPQEDSGDMPEEKEQKEIHFSLQTDGGLSLSAARSAASLAGMKWKLFCFDADYRYLFEEAGTVDRPENGISVSVPKGQLFRFLFLFATVEKDLPSLASGSSYWELEAYTPELPLSDPMSLLVSKGEEDGTIRVAASTSRVSVFLVPRAAKVVVEKESTASEFTVEAVVFSNAAVSVPYAHVNPLHYDKYEGLPEVRRTDYRQTPDEKGACYLLPDLCGDQSGTNAVLQLTAPKTGLLEVPATAPVGMALNAAAGRTYYIKVSSGADGKPVAVWNTRPVSKTLRLATQNLWGKNSTAALDYFNQIDVDVLCGQECSNLSESEIRAKGLYVHSHTNNGQGRCCIISRYPFAGTTPNGYGVYIDLGDGITALVMNCHGAYKPYGPYQLAGIDYGGYPATDDVDHVIKVNEDARREMVEKLLEDVASATTPFLSISGDFNEPSWLDWTEETLEAGTTPYVIQWPTTLTLWEGGVKGDAYRTIHPDPVANPGYTWTPFPAAQDTKDRLDMTLYRLSPGTTVKNCRIIGEDAATSDMVFPSWLFDHRGVRTEFVYTR